MTQYIYIYIYIYIQNSPLSCEVHNILLNMGYRSLQPENLPRVKKHDMEKLTTHKDKCNNSNPVLMISKITTSNCKIIIKSE